MKKKIQFIFLIFLLAFPLSSAAKTYTLAVAGIAENSPTHRIASKVAEALSNRLGHTIIVLPLPAKRAFNALENGLIDGDFSRVIEFERSIPGLIRVTEPIGNLPFLAYVTSVDFTVDGWQSLAPYSVAYNRGYRVIEDHLKPTHNNLHPLGGTESALLFLAHGRADVYVNTQLVVSPLLKMDRFKKLGIRALQPPVAVIKSYTFFAAKHESFAKKYEVALTSLKREGVIRDIVTSTP